MLSPITVFKRTLLASSCILSPAYFWKHKPRRVHGGHNEQSYTDRGFKK